MENPPTPSAASGYQLSTIRHQLPDGCQTWTRTKTSGLTGRRATLTLPGNDAQPVVRLPGIAPGPSPWQADILLLNHSRESKRAGSVLTLPARAISTKNKHLL